MTRSTNPSATDGRSLDTIHALHSDPRRTAALEVIAERELPLSLGEIARAVSDRRSESGDGADPSPRDLAISLHHVHLPKLDAADAIAYDPETRTVTADRTESILALA